MHSYNESILKTSTIPRHGTDNYSKLSSSVQCVTFFASSVYMPHVRKAIGC